MISVPLAQVSEAQNEPGECQRTCVAKHDIAIDECFDHYTGRDLGECLNLAAGGNIKCMLG
jgi:hypothetical protein